MRYFPESIILKKWIIVVAKMPHFQYLFKAIFGHYGRNIILVFTLLDRKDGKFNKPIQNTSPRNFSISVVSVDTHCFAIFVYRSDLLLQFEQNTYLFDPQYMQ